MEILIDYLYSRLYYTEGQKYYNSDLLYNSSFDVKINLISLEKYYRDVILELVKQLIIENNMPHC